MNAISAALARTWAERSRLRVAIALAVGLAASGVLVMQRLGVLVLPGCAPHSACADIIASSWNSLWGWPVSFLGLAYFAAAGTAWLASLTAGVPQVFRLLVRLGALASLGCVLAMCLAGSLCWYCIAAHAASLLFWAAVERSPQAPTQDLLAGHVATPLAIFAASFALVTTLLSVVISEQTRLAQEQMGRARFSAPTHTVSQSDAATNAPAHTKGHGQPAPVPKQQAVPAQPRATTEQATSAVQGSSVEQASATAQAPAARRPYRLGPEPAKLQLVVFYDYPSEQCRQVERNVQELLATYGDMLSVTARHYPSCAECNLWQTGAQHANACRAALAAETAGLLKGDAGFWQMHRWLLEHAGEFTDEQLRQGLSRLGYADIEQFLEAMDQPQALAGVLADVVEGRSLRVGNAPAVFLNGKRVAISQKGNSLASAVKGVADKTADSSAAPQSVAALSPVDRSITETFSAELQLRAMASTVRIVNAAGRSMGSGVVIALRDPFVYVLTAQHIVPTVQNVEVHIFSEQSYPEPAGRYSRATVIATSVSADLAAIRFTSREPWLKPLAMIPPEQVPTADDLPLLTIGCGGDALPPTCLGTQTVGARTLRRSPGSPAASVWEVADPSAEGRSGGPLIDQRGYLLGIASGNSAGHGYYTHVREIYRFIEDNGLEGLCNIKSSKQLPLH